MTLSAPIHQLKRQARQVARDESIALHSALDRIAAGEGYGSWSLLAAKYAVLTPAARLFGRLKEGDFVLVGARPGHGKTRLALELAAEAVKAGGRSSFFTLEYTGEDVMDRLRAIGFEPEALTSAFEFDCSDGICADYIIDKSRLAPRGTLIVIDYLQLLDQRREHPPLASQVAALKAFADARGLVIVFIAQIDRSYDPARKPYPDWQDVRLPNPVDLAMFTRACFLNNGEVSMVAQPH